MVQLDNRDVFVEELENAGYTIEQKGDYANIIEPKNKKPQMFLRIEPTGKLNIWEPEPSLVAEIDSSGNLVPYSLTRKDFVKVLYSHITPESQSVKDMLGYLLFNYHFK